MKAARLVLIIFTAVLQSGCMVKFDLGADAQYGRIVAGYEPPPSLWEWQDAPRALSLSDFKEVQR